MTKPNILDPSFKYEPSFNTDIRRRFGTARAADSTAPGDTAKSDLAIALHALKMIEHATAPGDATAYHENAYSLARMALSDISEREP